MATDPAWVNSTCTCAAGATKSLPVHDPQVTYWPARSPPAQAAPVSASH